ncbi:hepatoma-derived growth factor-related protein 2 isoform X1 [Episyrphus balteatus]|uniref:hepatoma-derived growth factor-related protein 2 isoform X1 n=1 Tax=Episyrphus balteatus TaxID=286459 RepID=UPI002484DBAB|nr:hepatoma-derived growth factor-related protein 2 isoform X1 [Episyrphus balteatus]
MGKKDKSFNIGDLVFAKVKGYPPWPAKITKTNNKKYSVYFYGTGETANIKIEDLFNYKDSKNKFATDKNLKRAHFREAIAQIEAALEGEDSAPINLEEFDASVVAQSDAGGNDTTIATDLDETNLLDDTVAEEADEVSSAATTAPQAAAAEETVDEVATEVVEEPRAVVDVKPPVEEIVSSSTSPAAEATAAGAKGANETEIVSRSGRKIKPKRYMDEEEVPQNPSKRIKAETKDSPPNDAKPKSAHKKASKTTPKSDIQNNLLLAYTTSNKCVGIKLDFMKPETFEDEAAKKQWEENMRKECYVLKEKIEHGIVKVDSIKERLVLNPNRSRIHKEEAERFTNEMIDQEDALFTERDFIRLSQELRESLGLKRANIDRCLSLLDQFKDLELNQLMLKRNADCVDTIRRLRKYVGNLKQWNLSSEEQEDFNKKAGIIRERAAKIYQNFKKMFIVKEDQHFWEQFCEMVDEFRRVTKHISESNRFLITEKSYQNILSDKEAIRKEEEEKKSNNLKTKKDSQDQGIDGDVTPMDESKDDEEKIPSGIAIETA